MQESALFSAENKTPIHTSPRYLWKDSLVVFEGYSVVTDNPAMLRELREVLAGIDDFSLENTERIVHGWIEQKGYSLGQVMNTLRLALVGAGKGPGMYDVTSFIGKEETLRRIDNLLRNLKPGE